MHWPASTKAVLCAALTLAPMAAHAQGDPTPESCRAIAEPLPQGPTSVSKVDKDLPAFTMKAASAQEAEKLKKLLKNRCWADARRLYFGIYQATIPDWMVYIDEDGVVYQDLHHEPNLTPDRVVKNIAYGPDDFGSISRQVHGVRFVYAFVFWNRKANSLASPATSGFPKLVIRRRVVQIEQDPMLALLISALSKGLGVAQAQKTLADSADTVQVQPVEMNPPTSGLVLYGAATRFDVVDNVRMELSVFRADGKPFDTEATVPTPRRALLNFANARERTFEIGVVPAITNGNPIRTYTGNLVTNEGSRNLGGVYLAASLNLLWYEQPVAVRMGTREPWRRSSFGPVIGTNLIRGNIGDELLLGGVFGHILGDAGFIFAGDYVAEPTLNGNHVSNPKRWRKLYGFMLTF